MLPCDKLLDFPSPRQLNEFIIARAHGAISVFKTRQCDNCKLEIPDEFRCCSVLCFDKLPKEDSMGIVTWSINLEPLFQGKHRIETHEGAVCSGRVTKIEWSEVDIHGRKYQWPLRLILNDDSSDTVDWAVIKSITRL